MNRRVACAAAGTLMVATGLVLARPDAAAPERLGPSHPAVRVAAAEPADPTPSATPTASPSGSSTRTSSSAAPDRNAGPSLRAGAIGLSVPLSSVAVSGSVLNPPTWGAAYVRGLGRVAPGHVGTSVIIGHLTVGSGAGVFVDLPALRDGDAIVVTDAAGVSRTLRVVATSVEAKSAVQSDPRVWGANSSLRRVVLVTCDSAQGYRADGHRVANFYAVAEAPA